LKVFTNTALPGDSRAIAEFFNRQPAPAPEEVKELIEPWKKEYNQIQSYTFNNYGPLFPGDT
jgi:hypothetical protein